MVLLARCSQRRWSLMRSPGDRSSASPGASLAWPVDDLPGQRAGMPFVVDGDDAVDDDVFDADRELVGLLERGAIDHAILVEDRDVGGETFFQPPSIHDAQLVGVH